MADLWKLGQARANKELQAANMFVSVESKATSLNHQLSASALLGDTAATRRLLSESKFDAATLSEALRGAARGGSADVLRLLLEKGADVNMPDDDGYTCFHEACFWGQAELLPMLAANGARARGMTRVGRTGWDLATRNGCSRAATELERLGMHDIGDQYETESQAVLLARGGKRDADAKPPEPPAVLGCGSNLSGQLGCPGTSTTAAMLPVPMPDSLGALPVAFIGCGLDHTLFVAKGGQEVFGCGSNKDGQLGMGRIAHPNHSAQCDTVIDMIAEPTRVRLLCNLSLSMLACGDSHTLALTETGGVMCCGANQSGQLGLGHTQPQVWTPTATGLAGVTAVSAGSYHSFFLVPPRMSMETEAGVFACGNNDRAQLGLGMLHAQTVSTPQPVTVLAESHIIALACGATQSWFLTSEGEVWYLAGVEWPPAPPPRKLGGWEVDDEVVAIAAGGHHCLFLTANGEAWAQGSNTAGQLGLATRGSGPIPGVADPTRIEAFQRLTHSHVRLSPYGAKLVSHLLIYQSPACFTDPLNNPSPFRPSLDVAACERETSAR